MGVRFRGGGRRQRGGGGNGGKCSYAPASSPLSEGARKRLAATLQSQDVCALRMSRRTKPNSRDVADDAAAAELGGDGAAVAFGADAAAARHARPGAVMRAAQPVALPDPVWSVEALVQLD